MIDTYVAAEGRSLEESASECSTFYLYKERMVPLNLITLFSSFLLLFTPPPTRVYKK